MSNNFFTTHGINNMKIHHKQLATAAYLVAGLHLTMCHGMRQQPKPLFITDSDRIFFANYRRMKTNVENNDLDALQQSFLEKAQGIEGKIITLGEAENKYCWHPSISPVTSFDKVFNDDDRFVPIKKFSYKSTLTWERRILNENMKKEKIALLELYEATRDHIRTAMQEGPLTADDPIHIRFLKAAEQLPHIKVGNLDNIDEPDTLCHWYKHREELLPLFLTGSDLVSYFGSDSLKQELANDKELINLFLMRPEYGPRMFILYDTYKQFQEIPQKERDEWEDAMCGYFSAPGEGWAPLMANSILGKPRSWDDVNQDDAYGSHKELREEVIELKEKVLRIDKLLAQKGCTHQELKARMKLPPEWQ